MTRVTNPRPRITKVISGGQTGVDRAALDVALELGISCGGWCPRARMAEDGPIPDRYPLMETATSDFAVRTELNVLHSEGTLIFSLGELSGGTLLTRQCAQHHAKPWLISHLDDPDRPDDIGRWLSARRIKVLNVAGPRESQRPGFVYKAARKLLQTYLLAFLPKQPGS